jgi:hypothetical protein
MDAEITIGELGRRLDRLETTVATGFERLATRLERDYVQVAVYATERAADLARIASLEAETATRGQQRWQTRLALTAALLSVPTSVIAAWLTAALT